MLKIHKHLNETASVTLAFLDQILSPFAFISLEKCSSLKVQSRQKLPERTSHSQPPFELLKREKMISELARLLTDY